MKKPLTYYAGTFFTDGGHGWFAIKRAKLAELNLLDKISPYSYQRGATVYLEEDCDFSALCKALNITDASPLIKNTSHCEYRSSPVRSYARYTPEGPRTPLPGDVIELNGLEYTIIGPHGLKGQWHIRQNASAFDYRAKTRTVSECKLITRGQ